MTYLSRITTLPQPMMSPLMLSDRLLTLAQDADRAGYQVTAEHLLRLASKVLDSQPPLRS